MMRSDRRELPKRLMRSTELWRTADYHASVAAATAAAAAAGQWRVLREELARDPQILLHGAVQHWIVNTPELSDLLALHRDVIFGEDDNATKTDN